LLEKSLTDRFERKIAKKQARSTIRGTKRRDNLIQQQEYAAAQEARNREAFVSKRAIFDMLISHMEETHEKQHSSLVASQDRRLQYEKQLSDLECRHLKEEVRNTNSKKFHVRQTYQM
jgi:hypothetical protein